MISRIIVFLVILSLISPEIIDDATYIDDPKAFYGDFLGYIINTKWLVVWNIFYFSIYWEFHHPNWLSLIFFRGVGLNHQAVISLVQKEQPTSSGMLWPKPPNLRVFFLLIITESGAGGHIRANIFSKNRPAIFHSGWPLRAPEGLVLQQFY